MIFNSKFLPLLALAALSSVASAKTLRYKVKGDQLGPDDDDGCYRTRYLNKKGTKEIGDYTDCVTSAIEPVKPDFSKIRFTVVTTFSPDKPNNKNPEVTTTCEVTVTKKESLEPDFNAKEKCDSGMDKGVVAPDNKKGRVKLNGKVENTNSPKLTFDLNWIIKLEDKTVFDLCPEKPGAQGDPCPAGIPFNKCEYTVRGLIANGDCEEFEDVLVVDCLSSGVWDATFTEVCATEC